MHTLIQLTQAFTQWLARAACYLRDAQQQRRELQALSQMSAYELRDIGISHAALAASAPRPSCCA